MYIYIYIYVYIFGAKGGDAISKMRARQARDRPYPWGMDGSPGWPLNVIIRLHSHSCLLARSMFETGALMY